MSNNAVAGYFTARAKCTTADKATENKDEYKILLRDFDGNYANPFGLPDKWSLTENIFKEIYQ